MSFLYYDPPETLQRRRYSPLIIASQKSGNSTSLDMAALLASGVWDAEYPTNRRRYSPLAVVAPSGYAGAFPPRGRYYTGLMGSGLWDEANPAIGARDYNAGTAGSGIVTATWSPVSISGASWGPGSTDGTTWTPVTISPASWPGI